MLLTSSPRGVLEINRVLSMRKLLLLLTATLAITGNASAQDIITLIDGSTIQSKVVEVDSKQIKYRLYNVPESDILTISTNQILKITYESGDVETYNIGNGSFSSASAGGPVYDEVRHFGVMYTAGFKDAGHGAYGIVANVLIGNKPSKWGVTFRLLANIGIAPSGMEAVSFNIGPNYGFAINNNFIVFAPLTFNGSLATTDKGDKFGWGFSLSPTAHYRFGNSRFGAMTSFDLGWTHGVKKLGTGFTVGITWAL